MSPPSQPDGNQVFLAFDEGIDQAAANLPPASAFTVRADGTAVDVATVELDTQRDDGITLDLAAGEVFTPDKG